MTTTSTAASSANAPAAHQATPWMGFLFAGLGAASFFLALFVLASQNRLGKQADLRANLDLQIDLLVEREMTAVLQLLNDIVKHQKVPTHVTEDSVSDLIKKTDVQTLADEVDR